MAAKPKDQERNLPAVGPTGIIAPPPILVESPAFTGTLAMLFTCVRDRKVDLMDVPIAPICSAYIAYLVESKEILLDEAASALLALSYLIERKAWGLLPTNEEEPEDDEILELPDPTIMEYQPAMELLRFGEEERSNWFFRPVDTGKTNYEIPIELAEVSVQDLSLAFARVLAKAKPEEVEHNPSPKRSLSDVMKSVVADLEKGWLTLEQLLPEDFTRSEVVWTFLALLELIRLGQALLKFEGDEVVFTRFKKTQAQPEGNQVQS